MTVKENKMMTKLLSIKVKLKSIFIVALFIVLFSSSSTQSRISLSNSGLVLILDNSGSMGEVFEGDIKLNAAKKAIKNALENSQLDSLNMGLVEIGGHCSVQELVPLDLNNRQDIVTAANNVHPRPYLDGATPIAESIHKASKMLKNYRGEKRIILVSDGGANCQGEKDGDFPLSACDMVASLNNQGISFSLNLIGYGANDDKEFECIANLSDNYSYDTPDNPEELRQEIEENSDFWKDSQTLIEQITEFLTSLNALIAAVFGILVVLGLSNNKSSDEDNNDERW